MPASEIMRRHALCPSPFVDRETTQRPFDGRMF
jgi:hypothetical protein